MPNQSNETFHPTGTTHVHLIALSWQLLSTVFHQMRTVYLKDHTERIVVPDLDQHWP